MERNARMERRVGGCSVISIRIRGMKSGIPRDMSCLDSYETAMSCYANRDVDANR
jgi:hypothetical protein